MKAIIGIDPGLKSTGFGIIKYKDKNSNHVSHGVIKTDSNLDMGMRLVQIYRGIEKIIDKYNPEEAGIEDIFFAKNLKSAIPVAQAKGVIMFLLAEKGIKTYSYTPLEVKRAVTGNGRATKYQIQEIIRIILHLPNIPRPDHAADALAVAICHVHLSEIRNLLNSCS